MCSSDLHRVELHLEAGRTFSVLALHGPCSGVHVSGSRWGLDDAVLDIEVTPNRPDFLSVVGVAREVAAATGVPFTMPATAVAEGSAKAAGAARIAVADAERCPRYLARVIDGVGASTSPLVVQARLTAAGMRPISAIVDATNYVMLELGQPLHAFDLERLAGPAIDVRRDRKSTRLNSSHT